MIIACATTANQDLLVRLIMTINQSESRNGKIIKIVCKKSTFIPKHDFCIASSKGEVTAMEINENAQGF